MEQQGTLFDCWKGKRSSSSLPSSEGSHRIDILSPVILMAIEILPEEPLARFIISLPDEVKRNQLIRNIGGFELSCRLPGNVDLSGTKITLFAPTRLIKIVKEVPSYKHVVADCNCSNN